jgi:hypothetical protein
VSVIEGSFGLAIGDAFGQFFVVFPTAIFGCQNIKNAGREQVAHKTSVPFSSSVHFLHVKRPKGAKHRRVSIPLSLRIDMRQKLVANAVSSKVFFNKEKMKKRGFLYLPVSDPAKNMVVVIVIAVDSDVLAVDNIVNEAPRHICNGFCGAFYRSNP